MSNWKEEFGGFWMDHGELCSDVSKQDIEQFIQTKVIEKIISDIGHEFHENTELDSETIDSVIKPIKAKWLKE